MIVIFFRYVAARSAERGAGEDREATKTAKFMKQSHAVRVTACAGTTVVIGSVQAG